MIWRVLKATIPANEYEKRDNSLNSGSIKTKFSEQIAPTQTVRMNLLQAQSDISIASYAQISLLKSLFGLDFTLFQLYQLLKIAADSL